MFLHLSSRAPGGWEDGALLAELQTAGYAAQAADTASGAFTYFDTRDGALRRAGKEVRREEQSGLWHLFADGQLAAVSEGEQTHAGGTSAGGRPPPDWLPAEAPLLPLLRAELEGHGWTLRSPSAPPIRLRLERWSCSSAFDPKGRTVTLQLFEVGNPAAEASGPLPVEIAYLTGILKQRLGLQPLAGGLLSLALPALGVEPPWAPPPPQLRPTASDGPEVLLRKILATQAHQLRRNTRGALLNLDPEFLHDLRVATRRARTALRLFAPLLQPERAAALNEELAWVARSVGPVRDLDVFLQELSLQLERGDISAGSRDRILASLRGRQQALRQPLAECLRSERFRLLAEALAGPALGAGEAMPAPPQFAGQIITPLVARVRRTAARVAGRPSADALHRMRIRLKRLRYACEFFAPQVGPALAQEARRLARLQDRLGAGQDAAATLGVLAELAAQTPSLLPEDLLALGALMQVQREIRRESAHRFQELSGNLPALLTRIERSVRRPA